MQRRTGLTTLARRVLHLPEDPNLPSPHKVEVVEVLVVLQPPEVEVALPLQEVKAHTLDPGVVLDQESTVATTTADHVHALPSEGDTLEAEGHTLPGIPHPPVVPTVQVGVAAVVAATSPHIMAVAVALATMATVIGTGSITVATAAHPCPTGDVMLGAGIRTTLIQVVVWACLA